MAQGSKMNLPAGLLGDEPFFGTQFWVEAFDGGSFPFSMYCSQYLKQSYRRLNDYSFYLSKEQSEALRREYRSDPESFIPLPREFAPTPPTQYYPAAILSEHAPKTAESRVFVASLGYVSNSPPSAQPRRIARPDSPAASVAPLAVRRARRTTSARVKTEAEAETDTETEKQYERKDKTYYMTEEWVSEDDLTVIRWDYKQGTLGCFSSNRQVASAKYADHKERGERKVRLYLHELEKLNQELTRRGDDKIQLRERQNHAEWMRIAWEYSDKNEAKIEAQKAAAKQGGA